MPNVFGHKELRDLLKFQSAHPALWPSSNRVKLDTQDDERFLAFLKYSTDGSETVLAVFNFTDHNETIVATLPDGKVMKKTLPGKGYSFDVI